MKSIILFLVVVILISGCDHNYRVNEEFPKLKRPIIVIGKKKNDYGYAVIVRDSAGTVLLMGNMSTIGNIIGESYNIGDTIK